MKRVLSRRLTFISKSLLWSLLLYVLSMAIINWDEVVREINKQNHSNIVLSHSVPANNDPIVNARAESNQPSSIQKNIQSGVNVLSTVAEMLHGLGKAAGI